MRSDALQHWVRRPLPAVFDVAATVVGNWASDRCSSMAAALAFYAAFSLAPLLVTVIAVGGMFFGVEAVEGRLYAEIESLVGHDSAAAVQAMVANAWKTGDGSLMGWLSLAGTAVGATATFAELSSALQAIWRSPPAPHVVAALIRVRLVSFGLVLGIGFLLVILLIADAAVTYATAALLGGGLLGPVLGGVQQVISFGFLWLAFTVLLVALPDAPVAKHDAAVGAAVAALLFNGGKHLFAIYLAQAGTANVFGVASSLALLMMWLYFSSAVFLFGAELAAELGRRGKHRPTRRAGDAPDGETPWLLK